MKALDDVVRWVQRHEKLVLRALGALGALAVLVRIAVVILSIGSNDIYTWFDFAQSIHEVGLLETYRSMQGFNHPPLMGFYALVAGELSGLTGGFFPYLFKVGPVAADLVVAALLWRTWRARGRTALGTGAIVCAYLWSPIAILVAAHHGNTDSMLAAAMLAAAILASGGRSPFAAGLVLGAAINVKLVPVFLIPPLWAQQRGRRGFVRYGAGLAVAALPFVPVLLLAGREFYRNAIAYNSDLQHWGVQLFLLKATEVTHLSGLAITAMDAYSAAGRWIMLAAALGIGVLGRRIQLDAIEAAALTMAAFLLLTPGFGIQYAVWVVPLLFATAPRRAVAYSVVGGVFAFLVYLDFWNGEIPAYSHFTVRYAFAAALFGLWAWLILLAFARERLVAALRTLLSGAEVAAAEELADKPEPEGISLSST